MQVQANGTPNMTVVVGQGTAGIGTGTYPTSYKYWIANTTTTGTPAGESVTITTASASNPRIDTIVAYVNEGGSFSTSPVNQPGGWTLAAVAGTPNASPTAPSGGTIQSAVGGSNPYIVLADVLVGTSVTQINSGNITDRRTMATLNVGNIANGSITPAKMLGIDLFAVTTNSMSGGTVPAAGTGQFYMQPGNQTVTTNSNGDATITFPSAFPNGIVSIVITNSGSLADDATASVTYSSLSGFNISSLQKSAPVNVSWIAIGW